MTLTISLLTFLAIVILVFWLLASGKRQREGFTSLLKTRGLLTARLPVSPEHIMGSVVACYRWQVERATGPVDVHLVTASASSTDTTGVTMHLSMTAIIPATAAEAEVVERFRQALSWTVGWRHFLSYRAPRPEAVTLTPEGSLLVRWNLLYRADVLKPRLDFIEAVLAGRDFVPDP